MKRMSRRSIRGFSLLAVIAPAIGASIASGQTIPPGYVPSLVVYESATGYQPSLSAAVSASETYFSQQDAKAGWSDTFASTSNSNCGANATNANGYTGINGLPAAECTEETRYNPQIGTQHASFARATLMERHRR